MKRKQNLKLNESQNQTNHHNTKTKMYYNYVCVVRGNEYTVFVVVASFKNKL